jgi:hypothetical protein
MKSILNKAQVLVKIYRIALIIAGTLIASSPLITGDKKENIKKSQNHWTYSTCQAKKPTPHMKRTIDYHLQKWKSDPLRKAYHWELKST